MKNTKISANFCKFLQISAFFTLILILQSCKKDVNELSPSLPENHREEISFGVTKSRNSLQDVAYYFVDGSPVTKTVYETSKMQPNGYSHFIATENRTEISHECHFFTTKSAYCSWGDAKGFGTTDELSKYEQLMAASDAAAIPDYPTSVPSSFSDLFFLLNGEIIDLNPNPVNNSNGQDAFCFGSYFWGDTDYCNTASFSDPCVTDLYFGIWQVNKMVVPLLTSNNRYSSWKGDVSSGCTGHKKAELKGYDRTFYRDLIGTITTQGDVYTPFLNIYANFDNKISSFKSRSKN